MHDVRAALRAATDVVHRRVEAALALDGPSAATRLPAALALLYGFWQPMETAVDEWAGRSPALAAELAWSRRRRTALLRADLLDHGVDPDALALCPAPLRTPSDADVLGWLYVAEGSTLGGAVLTRSLGAFAIAAPRAFAPYPDGPGPMWRAYLEALELWAGADELRRAAVLGSATAVFAALADWVETDPAEDVA